MPSNNAANPEMTRQYAGSIRHQKHLLAQREQYRMNHLARGPRDKRKPLVHYGNGAVPVQSVTCGDCRIQIWLVSKAMEEWSRGLLNLDREAEAAAKVALIEK